MELKKILRYRRPCFPALAQAPGDARKSYSAPFRSALFVKTKKGEPVAGARPTSLIDARASILRDEGLHPLHRVFRRDANVPRVDVEKDVAVVPHP